jgi:prepilin-type N-terminal cleavage/methylation domain-containing protein
MSAFRPGIGACTARSGSGGARAERGFSLVEIMIAAAVLGVALVALSAVVPIASYAVQDGNQLSTAIFLATERLEQVRGVRWQAGPPAVDELGVSASPSTAPVSHGAATFPDEATVAPPFGAYSRTVRIADCSAAGACGGIVDADLRLVTVAVAYRPMTGVGMSAPGTTKPVTLAMYVARR